MNSNRLSAVAILTLSALALPAWAADSATVKGIVYDADHKPAAKAQVRLLHRDKGEKKLEEVDTATTNGEGIFKFDKVEDGTYVIVAVKKDLRDRSEVTIHDGRDKDDLTFTVRPGREEAEERSASKREKRNTQLTGTIYASSGKAAADAKVKLMTGDDDADTEKMVEVATTTTDGKGNFVFEKIPATHYVLVATKGKESLKHTVTLNPDNKTENVKFKMK